MKTTLEIPDDLLIEAKTVAARRRTTLKELVTRSLRREIGRDQPTELGGHFKIGALGLPVLKGTGRKLSKEDFQKIVDRIEQDEDNRSLDGLRP